MVTPEQAAALREPFTPEKVGKLPRIYCGRCRDARDKHCDAHPRERCAECQNNITTAHLHLDYVGHADVTARLLEVDPGWEWEPLAIGEDGLPAIDQYGGMWIRLTVAGVTRLGYGDAGGKNGPDAVKEAIGDALRNAAMRFGVALDLWSKSREEEGRDPAGYRRQSRQAPANRSRQAAVPPEQEPTEEQAQEYERIRRMIFTAGDLGALEEAGKAAQASAQSLLPGQVESLKDLGTRRRATLERAANRGAS